MPVFNYECPKGHVRRRLFSDSKEADAWEALCQCGEELHRAATGATGQAVETIDNGLMTRRVTQYAGQREMVQEQSRKDSERSKELL